MQAQKQIHASQLWQQGLNGVIWKLCDTIVLKTLPLVVQCKKFFRWWVRKHETISTKKFAFLIVTLWTRKTQYTDTFHTVPSFSIYRLHHALHPPDYRLHHALHPPDYFWTFRFLTAAKTLIQFSFSEHYFEHIC